MDLTKNLQNLLGEFLGAVPNVIGAMIILLLGWIIARTVAGIVKKLLETIGIDRLGESLNEIDIIQNADLDIKFSTIFSKILYYILMLLVLVAASEMLALNIVSEQISALINYIPKLFSAFLVLIFGLIMANFIRGIVDAALESLNIPSAKLMSGFIFYFLFITVAISALGQAGFNTDFITSNLTLVLGGIVLAFAIAYGFASRHIMENLLSSLYSRSKFEIGDTIKVGNIQGIIIAMDSSSVVLKMTDRKIIIPLSKLTKEEVEIFD